MAGAQMGGGPGQGGVYDPREKAKAKKGKTGYWPSVQADLNKQQRIKQVGKTVKVKKIGR